MKHDKKSDKRVLKHKRRRQKKSRNLKRSSILMLTGLLVFGNVAPALARGERNRRIAEADYYIPAEDEIEVILATGSNAWEGDATDSNSAAATDSDARKALELLASSTGDLWNGWNGNTAFPGSGTEQEPYQISSISQLMGLSELVAAGISFEGQYIELTQDIELGNLTAGGSSWNPIGWYQNADELDSSVRHPFKGHFDGGNNCISGLTIVKPSLNLRNIGLFGEIAGGSVKNLTIEADNISGADNVGILAGAITGPAVIYNVRVTGYLSAREDAGGIAGELTGDVAGNSKRAVVENCFADGIVIYSEDNNSFTGGIAGNVQNAYLVDNKVYTYDNDSRIYGKGYVGGIAGRMNQTDIFQSYVSGTIGGNGSRAIGGIVGKYESGNLVLARFDGSISKTNSGVASREGTFIGTRENRHNFTYGTGSSNHLSYLFTTSAAMAKNVCGSGIDGDNTYTTGAHIGYWTDNEKKYTLTAGKTETGSGDRYFYEELESGVKYIVTQKLGKEFTASGYYQGLRFKPDHFAPGYQGEPVRGYLVSIPRIDARNANGTYDTDVALLTALPTGNHSFYRQIDKDNPAAVAAGTAITLTTAPRNSDGNRYQMVYAEHEPGKVKPPVYTDETGNLLASAYQAGGTYTFVMPECDTEVKAEYQKVTTELTMTPQESVISVIHTRNGDRKNPATTTEVRNAEGILIARYIDDKPDIGVEVQPITIHAEHNQLGETADKTVKWSVDDGDLLTHLSEAGYTLTDARVMPNVNSGFIQGILNREIQAQVDAGYRNKISNTIYYKHGVLTAASNPATSTDHQAVYGNTRLTVAFQIVDNTTIRVEGLALNKSHLVYTITRTLTGNRLNPEETYTCSEPVVLTATLNPVQPFYKNVSWSDQESGKIIILSSGGTFHQDCTLKVRFDANGKENPAWIQNVINEDNAQRAADKYRKLNGQASYTEMITAVSEDQTHGHVSASCDVTIKFETVDKTVIYPERVETEPKELTFDLVLTKTGKRTNPTLTWTGMEAQSLQAVIYPELSDTDLYKPYNKAVAWQTTDPTLTISDGKVRPNLDTEWVRMVIRSYPYEGSKEITLTATTPEGGKTAVSTAVVNVKVIDNTYSSGSSGSSGGGSGSGSKGTTVSGTKTSENAPAGSVTGEWIQTADGKWTFISGGRTYANEWAYIHNPYAAAGQPQANWFRFSETGHMLVGWYTDTDGREYYLNGHSDNTQGRMYTGWNWIENEGESAKCYYFDLSSGALQKQVSVGEWQVNEIGAWIRDGIVQIMQIVPAETQRLTVK